MTHQLRADEREMWNHAECTLALASKDLDALNVKRLIALVADLREAAKGVCDLFESDASVDELRVAVKYLGSVLQLEGRIADATKHE